jgi:hypothetical protein
MSADKHAVRITAVNVVSYHSVATANIDFDISFDGMCPLKTDVEWVVQYLPCGMLDEEADQELDRVEVGPVALGKNKFRLTVPPPNIEIMAEDDFKEATAILLTAFYKSAEFFRLAFFVRHHDPTQMPDFAVKGVMACELSDKDLAAQPRILLTADQKVKYRKWMRRILFEQPRLFPQNVISWDEKLVEEIPAQVAADAEEEEEDLMADDEEEEDENSDDENRLLVEEIGLSMTDDEEQSDEQSDGDLVEEARRDIIRQLDW